MSKHNNKIVGNYGERIAEEYLIEKQYRIIEKNFRTKIGELDIIAEKDKTLIFIEVKCRNGTRYQRPIDAINERKIFRINLVIQNYLRYRKITSKDYDKMRIDAIGIILKNSVPIEIKHLKNITI